jgi:sugar lactone lactonase YvrE
VHLPSGPSSHTIKPLSHSVGVTADISGRDDVFIVAGKKGYATLNADGEFKWIKEVFALEEEAGEGKDDVPEAKGGRGTRTERMRFNDGAIDSRGRFWAGSMNDFHIEDLKPEGAIYRLDADLELHRVIVDIAIPNGMGCRLPLTIRPQGM